MRPKYQIIVFIILSILILIPLQHESIRTQEVFAGSTDDSLITSLDLNKMAQKHLPDFDLVRKRPMWNLGREYVYKKTNDQSNVFIVVGLHPSPKDVEEVALNYLNEISITMLKGSIDGESIGDMLWWWSPTSDLNNITNIVFIRKNALIIMSSHNYDHLIALAKSIDDDLAKGGSYVAKGTSISSPQIDSIILEKTSVKEGESIKVTINAKDMKGETLEYQFQPGLTRDKNDPENVFILRASRDSVPGTFIGSHTIRAVVINESNVVSRVSEIKVNVY